MLVSLRVKDGNTNTKMSLKPGQQKSSLINKNFPAFSNIINLEKARYSSDLAGKFTSVPTAQTKSCTDAFLWKTSCKNLGKKFFSALPLPAKSLDLHLHRRSSCKSFSGEPSFLTGNEHLNRLSASDAWLYSKFCSMSEETSPCPLPMHSCKA